MAGLRSRTLGIYEKDTGKGIVCYVEGYPYTLIWPGARQAAAARWPQSWVSVWAPGRECHGSMQTKRTGFAGADQIWETTLSTTFER